MYDLYDECVEDCDQFDLMVDGANTHRCVCSMEGTYWKWDTEWTMPSCCDDADAPCNDMAAACTDPNDTSGTGDRRL